MTFPRTWISSAARADITCHNLVREPQAFADNEAAKASVSIRIGWVLVRSTVSPRDRPVPLTEPTGHLGRTGPGCSPGRWRFGHHRHEAWRAVAVAAPPPAAANPEPRRQRHEKDPQMNNSLCMTSSSSDPGPDGTAAIYTARAELNPCLEGTSFGGLMTTTEVENFPGFRTGIQGPELMGGDGEQAPGFGADLQIEDVESVSLDGPGQGSPHRRRRTIGPARSFWQHEAAALPRCARGAELPAMGQRVCDL